MVMPKNGDILFTADSDGIVVAYKIPSLEKMRQTQVGGVVTAVRYVKSRTLRYNLRDEPVGHLIIASQVIRSQLGDGKTRIQIWNPRLNEVSHIVDLNSEVLSLKYAESWQVPLLVGCFDGTFRAIEPNANPESNIDPLKGPVPPSGQVLRYVELGSPVQIMKLIRKNPDKLKTGVADIMMLAAACKSGLVTILTEDGNKLREFQAGLSVSGLLYADQHDLLLSGTTSGHLRFFSIEDGKTPHVRLLGGRVTCLGPFLAGEGAHGLVCVSVSLREIRANSTGEVYLVDPVTAEPVLKICHEGFDGTSIKWVGSMSQLLIASLNGYVSAWDTAGRRILKLEDKDLGFGSGPNSKVPTGYMQLGTGSLEATRRSVEIGAK
jgi:WD40 repeat protein